MVAGPLLVARVSLDSSRLLVHWVAVIHQPVCSTFRINFTLITLTPVLDLAEEVRHASKVVPRMMITTIVLNGKSSHWI